MKMSTIVLTLATALAAILAAAHAPAQQPGSDTQQAQPAADYSDAKLDAFAEAASEVNRIMFAWRGRMQQASGEQEQQEMLQQANQEIQTAVQETPNISMEEYQEIATAAGQNPELAETLRERVRAHMEAEQQDNPQQ